MSDSAFSLNSSYFTGSVFTFEAVNGVWQSSEELEMFPNIFFFAHLWLHCHAIISDKWLLLLLNE